MISAVFGAAGLLLTPFLFTQIHGNAAKGSPFANDVFQKAIFLSKLNEEAVKFCVGDKIFDDVVYLRSYVSSAPSVYQEYIEHRLSDYYLGRIVKPTLAKDGGLDATWKTDAPLLCATSRLIRDNPIEAVLGAIGDTLRLATAHTMLPTGAHDDFAAFVVSHPPVLPPPTPLPLLDEELEKRFNSEYGASAALPGYTALEVLSPQSRESRLFDYVTRGPAALVVLSALGALLSGVFFAKQLRSEEIEAAACLSLIPLLGISITAAVTFPQVRFFWAYWPVLSVVAILFAAGMARWAGRKFPEWSRRALGRQIFRGC